MLPVQEAVAAGRVPTIPYSDGVRRPTVNEVVHFDHHSLLEHEMGCGNTLSYGSVEPSSDGRSPLLAPRPYCALGSVGESLGDASGTRPVLWETVK